MATQTNSRNLVLTPSKPTRPHAPISISMVRVIIRVRPFLPHEISSGSGNPIPCVSSQFQQAQEEDDDDDEVTVHLKDPESSRSECYKLDSFFGQEDNNVRGIFEREVKPLIPGIFQGCYATVFAYGATGSGKTFTMQGNDELPGLIPLAMSTILTMCQSKGTTAEISYYEVYMDRCYDLLEVKSKEIKVLDDQDGQIHLRGLAKVPVTSLSEFYHVFSSGLQRRKVAHTGLNDVSSRSHAALVISVSRSCDDASGSILIGKLTLIDLAGNEDNRRTCNEGIRLQESAKINQSLFALSNVIYALNNNQARVPYRESKLTRILQDSLGGTSRALMVACLNPGEYQESVHTVSLAARSRHISNFVHSTQKQDTPNVKIDMEAKLQVWLESKGKTKSAQRPMTLSFPSLSKTPGSVRSIKKLDKCRSLSKPNTTSKQDVSGRQQRSLQFPVSNLLKKEGLVKAGVENDVKHASLDLKFSAERIELESKSRTPEKSMENWENVTLTPIRAADLGGSLPISERIIELKRSLRKALSPINSNINKEKMSIQDQICVVPFDPKTPSASYVLKCTDNKVDNENIGTPLDKYNAVSSTLKNSLAQEYIDLLNTASKEELLELKGIGEKMAKYIIELREISPLKSLRDLEKIGLTSKQVQNMFGRAAKGLFN